MVGLLLGRKGLRAAQLGRRRNAGLIGDVHRLVAPDRADHVVGHDQAAGQIEDAAEARMM